MLFTNARRMAALLMAMALLAGCGLTDEEKKEGTDPTGRTALSAPR